MFASILALVLATLLTACGSIDIEPNSYPIYSGPQNPTGTSTSTRVDSHWNGSAPGKSGDPYSPGAQPSMEELGAADTDGGTTDEEPPFHPSEFIQTQSPYPQNKNSAWDEPEFKNDHDRTGVEDPEDNAYWEWDDDGLEEDPNQEKVADDEDLVDQDTWQEAMEF